jgi:SPP1 family predicted phage head-tail adaptor
MLNLKPADMRFRVTIQSQQRVVDSNGLETVTWVDVATNVPAGIIALSGRELEALAQPIAQYNARVTIYKRNDIDESMRLVFDGRNYDIKDIIPDPTNNVYMSLMCKTGYTNG